MPKELADLSKSDAEQLKQDEDQVGQMFAKAVDAYKQRLAGTDVGPAGQERRNIALTGQASTDRRWAEFARLIGDATTADNCLRDATDAEGQIDPVSIPPPPQPRRTAPVPTP